MKRRKAVVHHERGPPLPQHDSQPSKPKTKRESPKTMISQRTPTKSEATLCGQPCSLASEEGEL